MVAVNVVIWVILVFHIMCTILMKCNIFISVYFCKPSRSTETWPHWYSGVYLQHSGNNLTTLLLWDLATRPRLTLHIFCIFVITWVNSTASKNGSNIPSASYRKLCLKGEGEFSALIRTFSTQAFEVPQLFIFYFFLCVCVSCSCWETCNRQSENYKCNFTN